MEMIKIHNAATGEVIEREMTPDELAQLTNERAKAAERIATKQEAKAEALAKLAPLGLTADDLKALGL
jgi:hypothetical protein